MISHDRRSSGHGVHCIRRSFLVVACLLVALTTTTIHAQGGDGDEEETVLSIDRFMLRLGPRTEEFDLQEKVTVLWTIENLVREYFENLYDASTDTLFEGAGITGLSVVPAEEETANYETIKFLGGAATFDAASSVTPTSDEIQSFIEAALDPATVIERLTMYFPELTTSVFVPLELGNRGFGNPAPTASEISSNNNSNDNSESTSSEDDNSNGSTLKPKVPTVPSNSTNSNQVNGIELSNISGNSGGDATTIGLSAAVAVGGALIVLLVGLLVHSRKRRMDSWRESSQENSSNDSYEQDTTKKSKQASTTKVYIDDEQEPSLRLPRMWGVTPSRPMDSGTSPGSSSNEEDSIQEILTCTSMDRRSIQNVESFEHQKRLVDTLKKEMMASNAEMHPYIVATHHLDSTEPCALSPTDLSAAALENDTPSRMPVWHAPSDSSFTGSGSGYDSPPTSSPLRTMMRNFQRPRSNKGRSPTSSDF